MKRILILGAYGMLGHKLLHVLDESPDCEVLATCRVRHTAGERFEKRFGHLIIDGVTAQNLESISKTIDSFRPDVLVNCIGIIKQLKEAKDPIPSIEINALFPHRLQKICVETGVRLVHMSTDCVFDGQRGSYTEDDCPSPRDLYGRTKLLGEIIDPPALTLRTSIIGHELSRGASLLDWFLSQKSPVNGFTRAIYTGLPTVVMARVIKTLAFRSEPLTGLFQVASEPISKYELLRLVAADYGRTIGIHPETSFHCDRSLRGDRFTAATDLSFPPWSGLVRLMRDDYEQCDYYRKETRT